MPFLFDQVLLLQSCGFHITFWLWLNSNSHILIRHCSTDMYCAGKEMCNHPMTRSRCGLFLNSDFHLVPYCCVSNIL